MTLGIKIAPALASGASLVVKPAEQTSLSTLRLAELAVEAGLPDGVLNVVPGMGETAGQAIGRHMDIDVVSFTGSTEVGRYFFSSAESNLKKIILECGGNFQQIVMADAGDLDVVAEDVLTAGCWNMGENCSCGSRLIVPASPIKDDLLEPVVQRTADWIVGDPQEATPRRSGRWWSRPHLGKCSAIPRSGRWLGSNESL